MVNIYLFIELLHTASAVTTVDTLKALSLDNCKFANVVVLSDEKLVAQLDCKDFDRRRQGDPQQDRQGRWRGADQHHRRGASGKEVMGIHEGARLSFPLSP